MIITKKKEKEKIDKYLEGKELILLVGCELCATTCKTGGMDELKQMNKYLSSEGKKVSGEIMINGGCHKLLTKKELRKIKDKINESDAILVLSCGAGVQSVIDCIPEKAVYPALDTLFLGNTYRIGYYEEHCVCCGECIRGETSGICPFTSCPKGILNGPCGGVSNGRCEVNSDIECAWVNIYNRMEKQGRLGDLRKLYPPRDYSKKFAPLKHTQKSN